MRRKDWTTGCAQTLALLTGKGIAVHHDGAECLFLAHRTVDVRAILGAFPRERLRELEARLPAHTLVAPVSREQERMLYHSEVMGLTAWNVRHAYELPPETEPDLLNAAMPLVVRNHDILRTSYLRLEDSWAQIVAPEARLAIEPLELPGPAAFRDFLSGQQRRLFDVGAPPLLRAWTCRIEGRTYLGLTAHHSVADAFTPGLLLSELLGYARALRRGERPVLKAAGEQYWQYALAGFAEESGRREEALRYWKKELLPAVRKNVSMRLPYRPAPRKGEGADLQAAGTDVVSLPPAVRAELQRFEREHEISHAQLFTAAIAILLVHGMDNPGAFVQLVHNRRDRASLLGTPGDFTNILFLAFGARELDPEATVLDVLQGARRKLLTGLRHAGVDFKALLALTGLDSYENYFRPWGDVVVNSTNLSGTADPASNGRLLPAEADASSGGKDQALSTLFYQILSLPEGIQLIASYRRDLFESSDIRRLSLLILDLAGTMAAHPGRKLKEVLDGLQGPIAELRGRSNPFPEPQGPEDGKPLTEGQKGLWLLQTLEPGMTAYNVPIALRIEDALRPDLLRQACEALLRKHPILQSAFLRDETGEPCQCIRPERSLEFHREALPPLTDEEVRGRLIDAFKRPFDLESDPLMRVFLFSRSERDHFLLIVIHHIIFDGASTLILMQDLMSAYESLSEGGQPDGGSPGPPAFHAFVDRERELLSGERGKKALAFWGEQLSGGLPRLDLPLDGKRPVRPTYNGATRSGVLPPELAGQLVQLAAGQGVSLFVVLLGIYQALLQRYTRQEELIVGLPTLGRPGDRFRSAVGYFVNTVPLRSRVMGGEAFSAHLKKLGLAVARALDHADYPFPKLVSELGLNAGGDTSPVFQTLFVLQNASSMAGTRNRSAGNRGLSGIRPVPGIHQEGDYDLSLEAVVEGEEIALHLSYNSDLFFEDTARRFLDYYVRLARAAVENPSQALGRYPLSTGDEERPFSAGLPRLGSAQSRPVHQAFERQALRTPDATALRCGRQSMTYRELNARSRAAAQSLQQRGIGPGRIAALCLERSFNMIVAILAVLRAGGVLLPLDPAVPPARLKKILGDSGAALLIAGRERREEFEELLRDSGCGLYPMSREKKDSPGLRIRLAEAAGPEDPAYCIYTSGSTGEPKGVLVSRRSLAEHCRAVRKAYALTAQDRILQFASPGVDTALEQILPGLTIGATVVLMDEPVWPVDTFKKKIRAHRITVADLPPGYLHELLLDGTGRAPFPPRSLRLVISGGEAIAPETVRLWQGSPLRGVRLINAYGPTEATITSTLFEVPADFPADDSPGVPIGRPVGNATACILDASGGVCPPGIPGELHIGGTGVAIGYLNRPELTSERFIDDPAGTGGRLYKTGDLARRLGDGNIEYLGRMDHQVKIRGWRVECGEIEAVLKAQDGVGQAAVIAKAEGESSRLIAFVAAADPERPIDAGELRKALQAQLPGYMIPSAFIAMDRIPLTHGGKIDRTALSRQRIEAAGGKTFVPAVSETEKALCAIWEKVLRRERVGITDNFFELGGHSLLTLRLASEIRRNFGVDLPLSVLFQAPTVAELQAALGLTGGKAWTPLVPLKKGGNGAPFFCVHPVGGNVLCYGELAGGFGKDGPFYGLQAPDLEASDHPGSVEGLAALYLRAVRKVQPQGPYRVGGWSMGGLVALEMARQLEGAGEEAEAVVLFDTYTPRAARGLEKRFIRERDLGKYPPGNLQVVRFVLDLDPGLQSSAAVFAEEPLEPEALLERIRERAKQSGSPLGDLKPERLHRLFEVFRANLAAMDAYRPGPLRSRVTLFCAGDDDEGLCGDEISRGWSKMPINLEIIRIPGTHETILKKPGVVRIQNELMKRFGESGPDKVESSNVKERTCIGKIK